MNYIELFGYPLSGKSTLLRNLNDTSRYKYKLSKTDRSIYRILSTIWFILMKRELILLYLKLPIRKYNFFSSIRKFFSFASNYKDYLDCQDAKNNYILDEGFCQGIWGLVTFFDFKDYRKEITILVNLYFERLLINNDFVVVEMNQVGFDEFKRRSLGRSIHHSYITCRLHRKKEKLDVYDFTHELILDKVASYSTLVNQEELADYIR